MESKTNGGIGFTGLLQLAFIVLKLVGVISWPWLWVLAPTWISLILVAVVLLLEVIDTRRRCGRRGNMQKFIPYLVMLGLIIITGLGNHFIDGL